MKNVVIRPFARGDQEAARRLILSGLGEHFATLDASLNPDLKDIWKNYITPGGWFLVAESDGRIVGTGALVRESTNSARIVRMSVDAHRRREGIGFRIAQELITIGRRSSLASIVVETNDDWQEAINLYRRCGFIPYDHRDGEIHLRLDITAGRRA